MLCVGGDISIYLEKHKPVAGSFPTFIFADSNLLGRLRNFGTSLWARSRMSAKCMFQNPTCYRSCWRMRQRWFWWDFWMKRSVPVSSCSSAAPNWSADGHENVTFSKWWAPPATSRPYTQASCRWPRWMHATSIIIAFSPNAQDLVEDFAVFFGLFVCFKDLARVLEAGDPFRSSATQDCDCTGFCPSITV